MCKIDYQNKKIKSKRRKKKLLSYGEIPHKFNKFNNRYGEKLEITPEKARKVIGIIDKTGESAREGKLLEVNL